MKRLGKKVRQMLTMLLAASMLVGSVPINALAMDVQTETFDAESVESVVQAESEEITALEETLDEQMSEVNFEENVQDDNHADEEEALFETDVTIEKEEVVLDSISGNQVKNDDELVLWEEEEAEEVDIEFTFSDDEFSSYVKVIHIDKNNQEKELEDNCVTTIAGEALKFRLEVAEGCKVLSVKMGSAIIPLVDGIYTIYPAASDSINIELKELEKYNITFSYDTEQVKSLEVKMGKKDVTLQDNVAVDLWEDSKVSINVTLKKWMKIVKVTATTEDGKVTELKAKEGTTYEIDALKNNYVVKIETSLDETKCNTLDIIVMGHQNYVSVSHGGKMYRHGERLLSKNDSESISVYLDNHYVMNQVLLNGKKVDFSGTNTSYTIDFSENKNQIIVFYITPKKSNEEKKLVFANKASHVTYTVNTAAPDDPERIIVKKDAGKSNTYTVNANEAVVEFTVNSKAGYEAQVTIPEEVLRNVTITKNQQVYSLAVATLGNEKNPTEIYIDEVPVIRTIEVAYDVNRLENLTAIVDGKYYAGEESYDNEKKLHVQTFQFEHGTEIVLQAEAKKGFQIGNIKEIVGKETLSEVKAQKKKYSYTVKANKDKTVEFQLEDVYAERVYDAYSAEPVEIFDEKNVYSVESGNKYKLNIIKGKEMQVVTSAVLKSGSKTYKDNIKIVDSENIYITIPAAEAGKTVSLEISCKDGKNVLTHTVKMKVLAKVKITSIENVTKGKLSQTADTVKEYKFKTNFSMEEDRLGVEIVTGKAEEDIIDEDQREELDEKAREDFQAELEKDVLRISVKTSKAGEKAYIKIYDHLKSTEEEKYYIAGGTVLVTSAEPDLVKVKPTVTLNRATNLSLILNLGMKKLQEIENGAVWYKIEGTPKFDSKTTEDTKAVADSFVHYVLCTGSTQTESIRVLGREDATINEGDVAQKVIFDIKVSVVQTRDKSEPGTEGENIVFSSKAVAKKGLVTREPSYETNLGIKVVKPQIYTGQKDVIVATPVFSANTSYQNITCKSKTEGITVWVDEKNNIVVSVEQEVELGKYEIEVMAETQENMVASKKTFTFEVVQGIYDIVLETPAELYKAYKQKAVMKVGVVYNENSKIQPKTKKLKWSLQDAEGNDIDEEHPAYKFFTIKNGEITIAENYVVSANSEENTFRVKAVANDYKREEELVAYSEFIEITNKKAVLGELVLVKETEVDSGVYHVTARSGQEAEIDKVHGSKLAVLKKGTPERDIYTESDFMEGLEGKLLFTCDNTSALKIKDDETIRAKNVAEKVTITAEMKDGSKVTTKLSAFKVVYAPANDLGVDVKFARTGIQLAETYVGGTTKFYGAADEILQVKIQEKLQGNNAGVFGVDYELKVQGAKIVKSNLLTGEYTLVANDSNVVLEVLNKTKNYKKTFTLKNMAFANEEVEKSKAMQLAVKGNLKTGYFTEEQTIVYSIPKESLGKYTHYKVTVNNYEYQQEKKTENYDYLIAASQGTIGEIQKLGSDGKVILTFKPGKEEENYYIPDKNFTYKLNIDFGTVTEEYEFKAAVKTNAVTIKTQKDKLADAKIKNTLTFALKESSETKIVLNNDKLTLCDVGTLMNKNSKGVANKFTEYFTLEYVPMLEGTGDYVLKLKPDIDVSKIKKSDLNGYISEYTYTDGKKTKTVYNAPIKVVFKENVQKFSLTSTTVLAEEVIDATVTLKSGKGIVNAGYVYMDAKQKFTVQAGDEGCINLQSKDEVKLKASNKCTMYVIPEGSYYREMVDAVLSEADGSKEAEAKVAAVMKKYGIKLSTTVKVIEKEKASGKITIAAEKLKQQFKVKNFMPEVEGSTEGSYVIVVPYKKIVDLEVENIYNPAEDSLVQVEKTADEDSITLTLSKEAFREAYQKNAKIYGKTLTVKAVVEFGEDIKNEIFAFKVTLPNKTIQIKDAIKKLENVVWKDFRVEKKGLSEEELVTENLHLIEEKVRKILSDDCELQVEIEGTAIAPSNEEEGKLTYKIILTNVVTEEQKKVMAEIPLGKVLTEPMELEESLLEAVEFWNEKTVTNKTTLAEILTSVRGRVEIGSYKHLRLYAKEVQCTEATTNNGGIISGIFCIVDITDSMVENLEVEFSYEIPKLMTFEEAAVAVEEAVEGILVYNEELGNAGKKESKTQLILDKAKEVLNGQEYFVQIKQGSTLKGELAKGDTPGKASLELEIIYLTTERLFKNIICEFQVLETEK